MLFYPDPLSNVSPCSLEEVHALAERGLNAGLTSGHGLGVLCIHMDGFEGWLRAEGLGGADALAVRVLEALPLREAQVLCGHRMGAQSIFYVQGVDGSAMRTLAQACCSSKKTGRGRHVTAPGLSVGAAHSEGQQRGAASLESVRTAAIRGARLALRTGGGRFAFIERFGPRLPGLERESTSLPGVGSDCARGGAPGGGAESRKQEPQRGLGAVVDASASLEAEAIVQGEKTYQLERMLKSSELAWQSRVEILERRLEKMGRLLERVGRNPGSASPIDTGVSSSFQTVQGLKAADAQFEAKAGLMSALFLANQKMREGLNGRSAG